MSVGNSASFEELVVRAYDCQRTRGDRVADEFGAGEELGDRVAQVLASDVEGVGRSIGDD